MSDDSDVTVEGSPLMTFAKRMEKRAKEALRLVTTEVAPVKEDEREKILDRKLRNLEIGSKFKLADLIEGNA